MISMSDKNKLKLAEIMYGLVVFVMLYLIISDISKPNYIGKNEDNKVISVISNLQADSIYNTYSNLKYGFKIDYPSNFVKVPDDMYGCGTSFYSQDKHTKLTVYGSDNVPYEPIEMLYKKDMAVIDGEVTYKALYKDWYAISWAKNNNTYYRRVNVGTEALNSIIFSYPSSNSSIYKPLLDHVISSFKPGDLESSH